MSIQINEKYRIGLPGVIGSFALFLPFLVIGILTGIDTIAVSGFFICVALSALSVLNAFDNVLGIGLFKKVEDFIQPIVYKNNKKYS